MGGTGVRCISSGCAEFLSFEFCFITWYILKLSSSLISWTLPHSHPLSFALRGLSRFSYQQQISCTQDLRNALSLLSIPEIFLAYTHWITFSYTLKSPQFAGMAWVLYLITCISLICPGKIRLCCSLKYTCLTAQTGLQGALGARGHVNTVLQLKKWGWLPERLMIAHWSCRRGQWTMFRKSSKLTFFHKWTGNSPELTPEA